jgi:hypothetical protein
MDCTRSNYVAMMRTVEAWPLMVNSSWNKPIHGKMVENPFELACSAAREF